ncbi:putative pyridoxal 5'-phosphate synthase subunit PDX2 [Zea mays]|uniref:Putative pyridoxal 5'-phosphate synthase subunit PDX2 n=1 Tax=Zea mays TaxID=4577 RepID=K7UGA6_MAIZE|nr:putative pyridoxal 5'-phosphate synthase subunit PDX2 [Zea mays]
MGPAYPLLTDENIYFQEEEYSKDRVIVAVRQGNILATAFHPELTSDSRWHRFFLDMDKESPAKAFSALSLSSSSRDTEGLPKNKPFDLPIFE